MANEIKLNTIKFLIGMFNVNVADSTYVKQYKAQIEELVRRNQISPAVQRLIYGLYGIQNTDIYKPSAQANKLLQVNWLMNEGEQAFATNTLSGFKKSVEEGYKAKIILKSAKDFIFEAFDFDENREPEKVERPTKNTGPQIREVAEVKVTKSKEVLADIAKFKEGYLDDIYYEYDNPSYTGCTGESRTLHRRLSSAIDKPNGAVLVYQSEEGDPCHPRYIYTKVPIEAYKVPPVKTTIPNVSHRVNTPISDPCHSTGYFGSRSNC